MRFLFRWRRRIPRNWSCLCCLFFPWQKRMYLFILGHSVWGLQKLLKLLPQDSSSTQMAVRSQPLQWARIGDISFPWSWTWIAGMCGKNCEADTQQAYIDPTRPVLFIYTFWPKFIIELQHGDITLLTCGKCFPTRKGWERISRGNSFLHIS